jgi:hypothetical protein
MPNIFIGIEETMGGICFPTLLQERLLGGIPIAFLLSGVMPLILEQSVSSPP